MKLYKTASIAFIILGALHTMSHIVGNLNPDERTLAILNQMANYKIQLFGEHSLLQFHNGFSLMMGFLLSAFGIQNLLVANLIKHSYLISTIIITSIALIFSILYFHLLSTAFIATSLICYVLSYRRLRKQL